VNVLGLLALLPIIVIAAAAVVVMLAIALRRDYRLSAALAVIGVVLTIAALPVSYQMAPTQATPLLVIDHFALFFMGLLLATGLAVILLCYGYFSKREGQNEELYLLLLTTLLGAVVLVASSHFATFFLGLETLSVSLFALIAYPFKNKLSLEAGLKYLILSGVSSAFLLFGIALIYGEVGTLFFQQIGALLRNSGGGDLAVLIGIVMIFGAMGFKLSLVPFHLWTPDVYQGAPAPISALIATVSKGAVFAVLLRYFVVSHAYDFEPLFIVISTIAIASILAGNLLALLQNNVKRILAYSSIAHMGYLLVAFVALNRIGGQLAVEAVSFYLTAYLITTLGAFGMITVLSSAETDADELEDYRGLFWRRPWLAGCFTAMLLSLAGIPLTVGFIGKFYIFAAGVDGGLWLLLVVLIIGSGIGLYYYLRIVFQMIKEPDQEEDRTAGAIPWPGGLALSLLTVLLLWFGVYPGVFMELIQGMAPP
jgi:NADH-quinone oxidoreductase subunit N